MEMQFIRDGAESINKDEVGGNIYEAKGLVY